MPGSMVDADQARAHVVRLINAGMPLGHVARAAAVSPATLSALIQGQFAPGRPPQQTIHDDTATRLLAVAYQAPEPKSVEPKAEPEHGTYARYEQHRRQKEGACELCQAAKRGYQVALRRQQAAAPPRLPDDLTAQLLKLCRAIVLRRPVGSIETLAREALRAATGQQTEANR